MENKQHKEVIKYQRALLSLSKKRNVHSAIRTYLNAERTLSVWIRTSLSIMIFGIAIDRFGLIVRGKSTHPESLWGHPSTPTTILGFLLVLFSIIMALSAGWRFLAFSRVYKKKFPLPYHHNMWLAPAYAFMVVIFGALLAFFMWFLN